MAASRGIDIRGVWQAKVWDHPQVAQLTPNSFLYDLFIDNQFDASELYHQQRINFFTCQVRRASEPLVMRQTRYTYQVIVQYYLQQTEQAGSTFNEVLDRLELVDELVLSELKSNWAGTIDFYSGASPQDLANLEIDGKQCWRGGLVYLATKTV